MTEEDIRAIVNRHDPMGLRDFGASDDEYDLEVQAIVSRWKVGLTVHELGDVLFEVFQRAFTYDGETSLIVDSPDTRERYRRIAEDLLQTRSSL